MFHGPRDREQKKKESSLTPGPEYGGTKGHCQHEKVNVELALPEEFLGVPGGIPSSGNHSDDIKDDGNK
jgi:hypothetical protein